MRLIRSIQEMQKCSLGLRSTGKIIGFVPTMGALHEGHLSLLRYAKKNADIAVMSIFINPTQFGPKEDFKKYPRPFEKDCEMAENYGCDVLFSPDPEAMYPDAFITYVSVEHLSDILEGAIRPGHFKGVATIVLKLFNIVMPNLAVFGQKDAQQAIILRKMAVDLNLLVTLVVLPTCREPDGLAMSSRNAYLTDEERRDAPIIYRGLCNAADDFSRGEVVTEKLVKSIQSVYMPSTVLKTEYIAIVDVETLAPVDRISNKVLVAVACKTIQTNTRLIDNLVLGGSL